jgi:hypothetical protein
MINKECSVMLKKLRESHQWCCVKLLSDYCYVWDVVLYRGYPHNDGHKPTIKSGSHEDINDAIKSAYEKAKVYLEKEEKNDESD